MFPHKVSIFNAWEDDNLDFHVNVTVLDGVLFEITRGTNILKSGLSNADSATVYIPFSVTATAPDGSTRIYVSPKEYSAAEDKSGYWTLDEGGSANSTSTYMAKGEITEALKLSELVAKYDHVYDVSTVDVYDFGGGMAHWRVSGK